MLGSSLVRRPRGRAGTLRIAGSELTAPIATGETLLSAAVRGKIPFPHMCNAGECGSCKCRLVKGHIRLTKNISRHVSPEELCAGFVLACQSVAESEDVEVFVLGLSRELAAEPAALEIDASISTPRSTCYATESRRNTCITTDS